MLDVLTNQNFLGALLLIIVCIGAGYILRRKNIITDTTKSAVVAVIYKLCLPCFAFSAFMQDFSTDNIKTGLSVFIASLILYPGWIFFCRFLFRREGKDRAVVASLLATLGQLTLFTMPLIRSFGSDRAFLYCGIMTLTFRGSLYFIGFPSIVSDGGSIGHQIKRVIVNPVMIGMMLGMVVWLTQGFFPQVGGVSALRIDVTLPVIYKTVSTLSDLVCPLSMLLIGLNLGESDLMSAIRDKSAWFAALIRTVLCPLSVWIVVTVLSSLFDADARLAMTLAFAGPSSVTLCAFCSTAHKEELYASHIAVLSVLPCLLTIPLFTMLCYM